MAYNTLGNLSDLTELKTRVGSTSNPTIVNIIDSPSTGGWSTWEWDEESTVTSNDIDVVTPTARIGSNGRWLKIPSTADTTLSSYVELSGATFGSTQSYTASTSNDVIHLVDGTWIVYLPSMAAGKIITIKNSSPTVTSMVSNNNGNSIEYKSNYYFGSRYSSYQFVSNGTDWYLLENFTERYGYVVTFGMGGSNIYTWTDISIDEIECVDAGSPIIINLPDAESYGYRREFFINNLSGQNVTLVCYGTQLFSSGFATRVVAAGTRKSFTSQFNGAVWSWQIN